MKFMRYVFSVVVVWFYLYMTGNDLLLFSVLGLMLYMTCDGVCGISRPAGAFVIGLSVLLMSQLPVRSVDGGLEAYKADMDNVNLYGETDAHIYEVADHVLYAEDSSRTLKLLSGVVYKDADEYTSLFFQSYKGMENANAYKEWCLKLAERYPNNGDYLYRAGKVTNNPNLKRYYFEQAKQLGVGRDAEKEINEYLKQFWGSSQ